jgi:hypothetical protein
MVIDSGADMRSASYEVLRDHSGNIIRAANIVRPTQSCQTFHHTNLVTFTLFLSPGTRDVCGLRVVSVIDCLAALPHVV